MEALISRSVSGLNRRRLVINERPARSSATACRVCSRFAPPSGTNRATAFSCRVMTISSPRTTRSSSSPNRVLAWDAVTVAIVSHQIDQSLTSLGPADIADNSPVSGVQPLSIVQAKRKGSWLRGSFLDAVGHGILFDVEADLGQGRFGRRRGRVRSEE